MVALRAPAGGRHERHAGAARSRGPLRSAGCQPERSLRSIQVARPVHNHDGSQRSGGHCRNRRRLQIERGIGPPPGEPGVPALACARHRRRALRPWLSDERRDGVAYRYLVGRDPGPRPVPWPTCETLSANSRIVRVTLYASGRLFQAERYAIKRLLACLTVAARGTGGPLLLAQTRLSYALVARDNRH